MNSFTENEGRISKNLNTFIEKEGKFSIFGGEKTSFFQENAQKRKKSKNEDNSSFLEPNSYYPENEEFTFTPHINATSHEMIQRRNNGLSVHERLFAQVYFDFFVIVIRNRLKGRKNCRLIIRLR